MAGNEDGYCTRLLGFSSMGDETSLDADKHVKYLSYVPCLFCYSWDNVLCLIGDKCNTNRDLATKVNLSLLGCARHSFNLAVWDILLEHKDLLKKVNDLILKLKILLRPVKLAKLTGFQARICNQTRWSSTIHMLVRYRNIRDHLHLLDSEDFGSFAFNTAKDHRFSDLFERLENLDSITKCLQKNSTTMAILRALFDCVMEDYLITARILSVTAAIVQNRILGSAFVKVQAKKAMAPTHEEFLCRRKFKISICDSAAESKSIPNNNRT